MAGRYEIMRRGEIRGPFRSRDLRAMIDSGELDGSDHVRTIGGSRWYRIDSVEALRSADKSPYSSQEQIASLPASTMSSPPQPPPPPPPPPPPLSSDGRSGYRLEPPPASVPADRRVGEQRSSEATPITFDPSRKLLMMIGYGFGVLGVADFALFNLGIWDFYAKFDIGGTSIEPFTPLVAGVVSFALLAMARQTADSMKQVRWVSAMIGGLALAIIVISSFAANALGVEWQVRGGTVDVCPRHTLNEIVEAFIADPQWETFEAVKGSYFVTVTGGITFAGRPATILLQFRAYGAEFDLFAVEVNGVAVPLAVGLEVLELGCQAAD